MSISFKTPLTEKENKALKRQLTERIAFNLKRIRSSKKLSQQAVAEKSGMHLTYLGHLEAGKYHASTFTLWKIAKTLGVGLDNLVS